jgi:RNA polymerase sporulation-specific sigma factor
MEELIVNNSALIYSIAKYFKDYCSIDDLYQAGCIGMINAYKNYNEELNVKFTTYAYTYILGEMKKLVGENKTLKIPRNMRILNLKIEKAKILLTQELMREPSVLELSNYLDVPSFIINDAINSSNIIYSIDKNINDEAKNTLGDIIPDNENVLDTIILNDLLSKLTPFEKDLIEKRYMYDYTQQELAEMYNISQVQVCRKEAKALVKMRKEYVIEDKLVA